jgi:hypothetical protein
LIHLHAGASSDDNTCAASKSFLGQSFEIKPTGFLYLKILLILVLFVASIIKLIIKKIYLPLLCIRPDREVPVKSFLIINENFEFSISIANKHSN